MAQHIAALVFKEPADKQLCRTAFGADAMKEDR